MKSKGQLLVEIVLILGLLTVIFGVLISFFSVIVRSSKYQTFNVGVAISAFDRYRNILIHFAQNNWSLLDSLLPNQDYYLRATTSGWEIVTGTEQILVGNEGYELSFRIGDYGTNTIKFVTTTAKYLNLVFEDYFLLPKLNVNF
jgi:hypothetical protein